MKNNTDSARGSGSARIRSYMAFFVLMYALILSGERIMSIVQVIRYGGFFATAFDSFVNVAVILSIVCGALLLALPFNRDLFRVCFFKTDDVNYTATSVTCGVFLISGMLHTEYTVAPVQFIAYGALIVAMILRTVEVSRESEHKFKLWYSLVYLVSFSMAIPVMYRSGIERKTPFHIIEAVAVFVLVASFTLLMRRVFKGEGEDLLEILTFAAMLIFDAVILVFRWREEVNTFVLIFASVTAALFVIGRIIFAISDRKNKK